MGKATESVKAAIIHFVGVGLLMAVLLYGLGGAPLIEDSKTALTGMAVAGRHAVGVVVVTGDTSPYVERAQKAGLTVHEDAGRGETTLSLEGPNLSDMVLTLAEEADRHGELVTYQIALVPD